MSKTHPTIDDPDIKIVTVFGDWHGDPYFAKDTLKEALEDHADIYIHVGDFGIWPDTVDLENHRSFLSVVETELAWQEKELWFIDGNHEHFDILEQYPFDERGLQKISNHVFHIPRGFKWKWSGKTFVGLGGAPSIDKAWRKPYISWFPQEEITDKDVNKAIEAKSTDVLFIHDAPSEYRPPLEAKKFTPDVIQAIQRSKQNLNFVIDTLKPKIIVHGHYHQSHQTYHNQILSIGLGADINPLFANRATLHTENI